MATTLRFILLGDDRASSSFNRFAQQVDKANRSIDRNQQAMRRQSAQAKASQGGILKLTGTVSGFGDVAGVASSKSSLLARGLAAANLATGVLEPALAGVVVTLGALAAAGSAAAIGLGAYALAAKGQIQKAGQAVQAQGKIETARSQAQITYQLAVTAANKKYQQALDQAKNKQQARAAVTARDNAIQAAQASRVRTVTMANKQYQAQLKQLPPATRAFAKELVAAKNTYDDWSKRLARPALAPLRKALTLVRPALQALTPLVRVTSVALSALIDQFARNVRGGGLAQFVNTVLPSVVPVIMNLGHAIGNVVVGIGGIIKAFLPVSVSVTGGITKITAAFAKWGQTLTQHSGFQSLMDMFRQSTPLAIGLLKNLTIIIKNVATAMTGMATPANSKALLQILTPLSQIMVRLTANQGLVKAVLYFLLLRSAFNQLKPALLGLKTGWDALNTGIGAAKTTYSVLGRLAGGFRSAQVAESAFSGTAGTIGGNLRKVISMIGTTVASLAASTAAWIRNTAVTVASRAAQLATAVAAKAMAAAQWLVNAAMSANPIGLIVIALAALAAAFVYAWTHSATFRKILIGAWNAVKGAAMAVVHWFSGPFVNFFTQTIPGAFRTVLNWVKHNWPWLLGALTGPIGLAVVWIIKHWRQILNGIRSVWNNVIAFIRKIPGWVLGALSRLGQMLLNFGRTIMTRFWNGIKAVWNAVSGWFRATPGRIVNALTGLGTRLYNFGHMVLTKMWNGIKAAWNGLIKWFKGLPSLILHALGIHSPPDWAVSAGKHIMGGLLKGMGATMGSVHKLMAQFSTAVSGALGGDPAKNKALARRLFPWGAGQWAAFNNLVMAESGYNRFATNPTSGAYGIAQALPPTKYPLAGQAKGGSHAGAQLSWMFAYIRSRYGTPKAAWAHETAYHWYAKGGPITEPIAGLGLRTGTRYGFGEAGSEYVAGQADMQKLAGLLAEQNRLLRDLGATTAAIPGATAEGLGRALNGTARKAVARGRHTGRPYG